MFKVSFKDNFKKVQTFNDKVTIVTLIGLMDYPAKLWDVIPTEVTDWMWHHPTVDVNWAKGGESFRLEFSGKAICSDSDDFNSVLGMRIAEAKAKIRLYKFMHTLCKKLMYHYYGLLYGVPEDIGEMHTKIISDYHGGLQEACNKYAKLWIKESQHLGKLLVEL